MASAVIGSLEGIKERGPVGDVAIGPNRLPAFPGIVPGPVDA